MPISFDKRNRRWLFQFNRVIAGKRHRANRLLPKGWTREQAQEYDQTEVARLYALATGISKPDQLIEAAVLIYLEKRAPKLKSFENIRRELFACQDAYQGKFFSDLPAIAQNYAPTKTVLQNGKEVQVPLKPATIKNRLSYIRAACRYAWKNHGMGEHNPAEKVTMPDVNNERHIYLSRAQFLTVAKQMKPGSTRAAVRIAFYSGMRAGEVQMASLVPGAFELPLTITKNDRPRRVPIHPRVAHIVRNPDLWPIKETKWTVSKKFKKALRAVGLGHARLHDVRHSTASEMANSKIDLFTVGGVLGHKSLASTQRYAHLYTETLATAINTVGKKLQTPSGLKVA